jgi:hypothetical protein
MILIVVNDHIMFFLHFVNTAMYVVGSPTYGGHY